MLARIVLVLLLGFMPIAPAAAALSDELAAEILARVDSTGDEYETRALLVLEEFYRSRAMAPVWVEETRVTPRARELAALLAAASDDALDPDDYGAQAIEPLLATSRPGLLAQLELRLSLAVMRFAGDLGQGRVMPHVADPKLFPKRDEVDPADVIAAAADTADLATFIDDYRPHTPRYARLKQALADYRALAEAGGWGEIAPGPALKPGMSDPRVSSIRDRLALWGDLETAEATRDVYDDTLVAAVKRMQMRHGLEPDGVVGKNTLAELNLPVEARLEQIMLNLERRRWMPDDLGRRYIFVNLADFQLKVVDREETIADMRVVVGKRFHKTPVFSKDMTYVVMNPYWHVPPSIAKNELLPRIKKDVGYLARNDFTLFNGWTNGAAVLDPKTIDWSGVTKANFGYKLRQGSGDGNALGRIKFMLPNRFNIYLHDTPAKALFDKAERSFSHGCIRVQYPEELARIALSETPGWDAFRIKDTIGAGARKVVILAEPLPVHISYLTAWVNTDGTVHFRRDIYGRDAILAEALLGPRATRLR